ncbi:MAG: complex I NDUFA9 subunit family protein [Ectothiorhodospiraceae bacterium]|nr:complex I NDUFA9 subunit family protein [Ectothiorhodospiraceae bacterium]
MATVVVFGGTGFLGREIARQLIAAGHAVRVASRQPPVAREQAAAGISHVQADVRDEASVAEALRGVDAAVNAVSLYVESGGLDFETIHVAGAGRLARLAKAADLATLVHVSGIGVSTKSDSAYVRARALGERAVRDAFPEAVILRPSVLFGPGDAFLRTLRSLTLVPVIPLFGHGGMKLQPVHVEDVAVAAARVLDMPAMRGRVFELGGARAYSYRETLELVLEEQHRRRMLLPVPFAVWKLLAALASVLPNPPLTRDQVILMRQDNIPGEAVGTFADLGIEPRDLRSEIEAARRPGA